MIKEFDVLRFHKKKSYVREDIFYVACQPNALRISNEFYARKPYFKRMEPSATRHRFVQKLPIISKQCIEYRKATVHTMRKTGGNVVQSIPFVDANRDTVSSFIHLVRASQSLSPSLIAKSPCLSYLLGEIFADKKKKQKIREHKTYGQTVVHETDIRLDRKVTASPLPSRQGQTA